MHLNRIAINNFRNLQHSFTMELPPVGLLTAMAPNTTGKTNFLESIVVLMRGKSWRAKLPECVTWGEDFFLLKGSVEKDKETDQNQLAVRYHIPLKKLRVEENGEPASLVSFYTQYPFILFMAEDSFLLSQGPALRRNFLNQTLISHRQYLSSLVQFHRVLKQRNMALRLAHRFQDIASWTDLLNDHATVLWQHRNNLVNFINSQINDIYHRLSGEKNQFTVRLNYGARDITRYQEELLRVFPHEQKYKYTLLGPHRDDLAVLLDNRPVAVALSRGQMRSLVIALKILAHRYIKQVTKETPLLLLDDVLNELDHNRQVALLNNLPTAQTIITCTDLPDILKKQPHVFLLNLGAVANSSHQINQPKKQAIANANSPSFVVTTVRDSLVSNPVAEHVRA